MDPSRTSFSLPHTNRNAVRHAQQTRKTEKERKRRREKGIGSLPSAKKPLELPLSRPLTKPLLLRNRSRPLPTQRPRSSHHCTLVLLMIETLGALVWWWLPLRSAALGLCSGFFRRGGDGSGQAGGEICVWAGAEGGVGLWLLLGSRHGGVGGVGGVVVGWI